MKIKTSPRNMECQWECKARIHIEIQIDKFGFRQIWKFSVASVMVKTNKVLSDNLTKNTKIVHFTQNIDILRKGEGEGQFPIGKLVDFIVNIWYTYY
ncbi:MAG: hypothetical protein K2K57_01780, partial [Oscillospiraceae bacterium]|nr:hypothetical protein [Oscillospiraceae bacterium]